MLGLHPQRAAAVLQHPAFRALAAIVVLVVHVALIAKVGRERFDYEFNAKPDLAPRFDDAKEQHYPWDWDRLVVSRWDAQHYQALGLRGYKYCQRKGALRPGENYDDGKNCELDFFPAYGWIGGAVHRTLKIPIDYAMFGVSLVASFAFLVMWTSRTMVRQLGLGRVWLSLLLFNAFSTGFTLVTVQTEPLVLALTMGAVLSIQRRWLFLGAVLAGACSAIRISGVTVGFAYCGALLVLTWKERPAPLEIARRVLLCAVSGGGVMGMMAYWKWRFDDPYIYQHAHERAFHHTASFYYLFFPDGRLLMQSIWAEPNEGILLGIGVLFLALGWKGAMRRFDDDARGFFGFLVFTVFAITLYGNSSLAFGGMSRYLITILPVFFCAAEVFRKHRVALLLWLFMSGAHYYNGSACFYVGQRHPQRIEKCGFARHFRHYELPKPPF